MATPVIELFALRADELRGRIGSLLASRRAGFADVGPWASDVLDRLAEFALRGKLLRGNLVLMGAELGGAALSSQAFDLAAALELFHSSILVHDDIIDQDALRRGAPTVHAAYARHLNASKGSQAEHHGASLALCAGDAGFFLVFSLLADTDIPPQTRHALLKFWAHEFAVVAFAEMDDVHLSSGTGPAGEADILRCYRFKTARYTFCLPLLTGLMLAGASEGLMKQIDQIAERLGLVFQLKDDELGLFGLEADTGKPVGSDIVQNKKTLYHHYLLTRTSPEVRARLASLFGSQDLTGEDTAFVQRTAVECGATELVNAMAARLASEAGELIAALPVPNAQRQWLHQLAAAGLVRAK